MSSQYSSSIPIASFMRLTRMNECDVLVKPSIICTEKPICVAKLLASARFPEGGREVYPCGTLRNWRKRERRGDVVHNME